MSAQKIYFDNAATTDFEYYNASSPHSYGLSARKTLEDARAELVNNILKFYTSLKNHETNLNKDNLLFTSSGTFANNLAILGSVYFLSAKHMGFSNVHIITSKIEHPSVIEPFRVLEKLGVKVTYLNVNKNGEILEDEFLNSINEKTKFISIQHVNSEIGIKQDIEKFSKLAKEKNKEIIFHTDIIQSFLKTSINLQNVDLFSISSHKIHGPKGIGALISTKYKFSEQNKLKLMPLTFGGEQEYKLNPGTENVKGSVLFSEAVSTFNFDYEKASNMKSIILDFANSQKIKCSSSSENTQPNIVNLTLPIKSESSIAMRMLEDAGFMVSTKSACSSKKVEPSHVLKAIGLSDKEALASIRISFSTQNSVEEAEAFIKSLKEVVKKLS